MRAKRHKKRTAKRRRWFRWFGCVAVLCIHLCRAKRQVQPGFIVGFYEQADPACTAVYTALLRDLDMVVLDISSYKGQTFAERYSAALRAESKSDWNLAPHSILFAVYLDDIVFTNHVLPPTVGIERELRRGVVYTSESSHGSNEAHFVGTFQNLKRLDTTHVQFKVNRRVFCPLADRQRNRCGLTSISVHSLGRHSSDIPASFIATKHLILRQQADKRFGTTAHYCNNSEQMTTHAMTAFSPTAIIWINLEEAKSRRTHMERQLQHRALVTRIQAFSAEKVKDMLHTEQIKIPGEYAMQEHVLHELKTPNKVSYAEMACTLSHIVAIQYAYTAGYEKVVITEDDVVFEKNFDERLEQLVEDAPDDWEVLQLFTQNAITNAKNMHLYFTSAVTWFPVHWSTSAYIMSRQAMHQILTRWLVGDINIATTFRLPGDEILRADEAIYHRLHTYTSVRALVSLSNEALHSSIQAKSRGLVPTALDLTSSKSERLRLLAPYSLLLVTYVRASHQGKLAHRIQGVMANYKTISRFVPKAAADIYIVCATHIIKADAQRLAITHSEGVGDVNISIHTNSGRFNKFFYVAKSMRKFHEFERVLLIDSDMDLKGFPLPEFFEYTQDYTVAGTVHGNIRESLERIPCKETRQWFKMFDIAWWHKNLPHTSLVEVKFIEQAFALLDGNFASWFFHKILTHEHMYFIDDDGHHIPRESDYGPDLLWCGAAAEWLRGRDRDRLKPCVLSVSHAILHRDDRQIGEQAIDLGRSHNVDSERQAWVERRPLQLYCRHFRHWCLYSKHFVKQIGGRCGVSRRLKKSLISL